MSAERALWRMDAETSAIAEIATTKPLQRRILILLDALEEATAREAAARREALEEAADFVEDAGDYGEGGWSAHDKHTIAYLLREQAREEA